MGQILAGLGGGGGGMSAPGGGGMGAQQPQQPSFGPESLVALLSNLMGNGGGFGGSEPMVPGQGGGNVGALGHASLFTLLPMLLQHLMPQQPPSPSGGGVRTIPGALKPPGSGGDSRIHAMGQQAQGPASSAAGMLGQLGLV